MVTSEQLIEALTLEVGNLAVNNIALGLQVDDFTKQVADLDLKLLSLADRNVELQARISKDTSTIDGLRLTLDNAGLRAKVPAVAAKTKKK